MTDDDVAEMRAQQRLEEAERNGNSEGVEDELETMRYLESKHIARLQQQDNDIVCEGFD